MPQLYLFCMMCLRVIDKKSVEQQLGESESLTEKQKSKRGRPRKPSSQSPSPTLTPLVATLAHTRTSFDFVEFNYKFNSCFNPTPLCIVNSINFRISQGEDERSDLGENSSVLVTSSVPLPTQLIIPKKRGRKKKTDAPDSGSSINLDERPVKVSRSFIVQLKIKSSDLAKIQTQFINRKVNTSVMRVMMWSLIPAPKI